MSGFGALVGGPECGLLAASVGEIEEANVRVRGIGWYRVTERRTADGRLVYLFQYHQPGEEGR